MTDAPQIPPTKRARDRSPEYPALSLENAVKRAHTLYSQDRLNSVPFASVLKHWGYAANSGTGLRILAALKHFGLLVEEGSGASRKLRLSDLAQQILLDKRQESLDRDAAIRRAAFLPKVYKWMHDKWPTLPSEETMEYVLTREQSFTPSATTPLIRDYKATLKYAKLDKDPTGEQIGGLQGGKATNASDGKPAVPAEATLAPQRDGEKPMDVERRTPELRDLTIPLLDGSMAILRTPFPLSAENYKYLTSMLRMMRRALTLERDDLENDEAD